MLERLVRGHTWQIKQYLKETDLHGIRVSSEQEHRYASEFANSLNFAEIGICDDTIAFLISSDNAHFEHQRIRTLMVLQSEEGSVYVNSNTVAADFFYVFENNTIKPIQLSSPLPLDGAISIYADVQSKLPERLKTTGTHLVHLLGSKIKTKRVLGSYGIAVPKSEVIGKDYLRNMRANLQDFLIKNGISDFVIKPDSESGGAGIRMFGKNNIDSSLAHILQLYREVEGLVVNIDERIFPYEWTIDGKLQDFNIRALIALGDQPKWLGAFVRYTEMTQDPRNQRPVNICTGAKYASLERVAEQTNMSVEEIMDVSLRIAKATQHYARAKGETPRGHIGIDLIPNKQTPCIEINDSHAGGFYELAMLYRKPLNCISEILLPQLGSILKRNHNLHNTQGFTRMYKVESTERTPLNIGCLRDISEEVLPMLRKNLQEGIENVAAYGSLTLALTFLGRYKEALPAARRAYDLDPNDEAIKGNLIECYLKTGDYEHVLRIFSHLGTICRENYHAYLMSAISFSKIGQPDKATQIYKNILESNPEDTEVNFDLGELYFGLGDYASAFYHLNRSLSKYQVSIDIEKFCDRGERIGEYYYEATEKYKQQLKTQPGNEKLRNEYDSILKLGGEFEQFLKSIPRGVPQNIEPAPVLVPT